LDEGIGLGVLARRCVNEIEFVRLGVFSCGFAGVSVNRDVACDVAIRFEVVRPLSDRLGQAQWAAFGWTLLSKDYNLVSGPTARYACERGAINYKPNVTTKTERVTIMWCG
jgi:hypothetical protein